ncbi:MAG: HEAT repeat domain-containing protein, partial [Nitrospira sp.]|nr:HEAT repeat domain-containing protein [Nitrospira sp.]
MFNKTYVNLLNLILVILMPFLTYKALQVWSFQSYYVRSQFVTIKDVFEKDRSLLYLYTYPEPTSYPMSHYQVIAQKNLFHSDRKLPTTPIPVSGVSRPLKPEPVSTPTPQIKPPDITLYGTVTGIKNYILARKKSDKESRKYYLGDEIDGYLIKNILRKKVIVAKNGQEFEVLIRNNDKLRNDLLIEKGLINREETKHFPSLKAGVPTGNPLEDANARMRGKAVVALGKSGDKRALPLLIQALQDEDEYVRESAADALGAMGAEEAIEALALTLWKDEDEDVRASAAGALEAIGGSKAIESLIYTLQDHDHEIREIAVEALATIG